MQQCLCQLNNIHVILNHNKTQCKQSINAFKHQQPLVAQLTELWTFKVHGLSSNPRTGKCFLPQRNTPWLAQIVETRPSDLIWHMVIAVGSWTYVLQKSPPPAEAKNWGGAEKSPQAEAKNRSEIIPLYKNTSHRDGDFLVGGTCVNPPYSPLR